MLRSIAGGALVLALVAVNLCLLLQSHRSELVFVVRSPRAAPVRFSADEALAVDVPQQIWYWPRSYLERYWRDPEFLPAGAEFTVELRGVELCRGRVARAVSAARIRQPTLRVLQLRSGPGPGPLLAGDLGFAFALTDGQRRFPCGVTTSRESE